MISYVAERKNSMISIVSNKSFSSIPSAKKAKKPTKTIVPVPKDQWVDEIIEMFKVPEVRHHIDETEGLLTKKESHHRIVLILNVSGIVLSLFSILLLLAIFLTLFQGNASNQMKLNSQNKPKVPHVFVIYDNGQHLDFSTDEAISPSKEFNIKLHNSKCGGSTFEVGLMKICPKGYFSYANNKYIYIFYADGTKDITYLNIETLQHRAILGTKFSAYVTDGTGVRVGSNFLISGNLQAFSPYNWNQFTVKSHTWSDKREKFISSPLTPRSTNYEACFTSYDRQVFIL